MQRTIYLNYLLYGILWYICKLIKLHLFAIKFLFLFLVFMVYSYLLSMQYIYILHIILYIYIFLSLVCAIQFRIFKFRENAKYQQATNSGPSNDTQLYRFQIFTSSHRRLISDLPNHNDRNRIALFRLKSILLDSERYESFLFIRTVEKYESIRSLSLASVSG